MTKKSDAAANAAFQAEQDRLRREATQEPSPFRDERPAPTSDGARTMREAAARNEKAVGGKIPLVP